MAMAGVVPRAACRYYMTSTGCRYGDRCWFRHGEESDMQPSNPGINRMCRFFMSQKGCRFGRSCRFRHITPDIDSQHIQELSNVFSGTLVLDDVGENDENNNTGKSEDKCLLEDEEEEKNGEIETISCGECCEEITSSNIRKALTRHYMSMFLAFDKPHTQFISQDWRFYREVMCDTCFIPFDNSLSMFRHIADKSKLNKRDGPEHREDLNKIVEAFVLRDMGEDKVTPFKDILMTLLTEDDVEEDEGDFDENDLEYLGRPLRQTSTLEKARGLLKQQSLEEERSENFGFTEDEVMELLCQGIKPWDPEAYDALQILFD